MQPVVASLYKVIRDNIFFKLIRSGGSKKFPSRNGIINIC
jgi:hypothetical protein